MISSFEAVRRHEGQGTLEKEGETGGRGGGGFQLSGDLVDLEGEREGGREGV